MSYTWEELREEYSNENYPPFGGPFTDALDPWEWLSKNFDPPKRVGQDNNLFTEADIIEAIYLARTDNSERALNIIDKIKNKEWQKKTQ